MTLTPDNLNKKYPAAPDRLDAKQRQAGTELGVFTGWLAAQNVPGMVGEFGWPHQGAVGPADAARWNALGTAYYEAAAAYGTAPTCRYGVFGADTVAKKKRVVAAGANLVHVPAYWDQLQPVRNGALDPTALLALNSQLADARGPGAEVVLECALQYPPPWILTEVPPFRDQAGNLWSAPQASGNNVRDWIFSATGRAYVADFIQKVFTGVALGNIDYVRTGGGYAGELHFPPVDNNAAAYQAFWSFSAPAQSGADLAPGLAPSPYPGLAPYAPGNTPTQDAVLRDWHVGALLSFEQFLIDTHRAAGWSGDLYILHPGFGMRSNWAQDGSEPLYVHHVASGEWPDWTVAQYADQPRVWPWCTWLDAPHAYEPDPLGADSNKAAWLKLLEVAFANGRHQKIMGENTGGNSGADLDRLFDRPLSQTYLDTLYGTPGRPRYTGVLWLDYAALSADSAPAGASLAALSNRIRRDDPRLWLTGWASGPAWGPGYNLGVYVNSGSNIDTAQSQASIHEAHRTNPGLVVGTNVAGLEFGVHSNLTFDYPGSYPDLADWQYLYRHGLRLVRLPLAWERLQPVLGAAFDPAATSALLQTVAQARSAGIGLILDLHNYCRYTAETANGTRTTAVLAASPGPFNETHLQDFWGRISDLFKNNDTVLGYDLMNEPHDLAAEPGGFVGRSRYTFDTGPQGWNGESSNVKTSWDPAVTPAPGETAGSLKVTATGLPGTGGYAQVRANDGGANRGGLLDGNTLTAWVRLEDGATGAWRAKLEYQTASYQWISPLNTVAVIAGQWVRVVSTFAAPIPATARAWDVQLNTNSNSQPAVTFWLADYQQGGSGPGRTPAQVWEGLSQAVVTYLRGLKNDSKLLLIEGYEWSHAHNWPSNHPSRWISDPAHNHRYQAHHYWDANKSGTYPNSYAAELTNAVKAGY